MFLVLGLSSMISDKKQPTDSVNNIYLRTMAQDLKKAQKSPGQDKEKDPKRPYSESVKKAVPPASLPVADEIIQKKSLPKKEKASGKKISKFSFILITAIVFVVLGLGGFFYWYNYLRPVNPSVTVKTHFECLNNQCLEIEGEGLNECSLDMDCLDLNQPDSLIPVSETKTIKLADSLESQLKNTLDQDQAKDSLKRILIVQQNEYLSFSSLINELNLSFPDSVLDLIATSTNEYTLFSYGENSENRLGIVVQLQENQQIKGELANWEASLAKDLAPLLLKEEIPTSSSQVFLDNLYQEIEIRYLNFPTSDLTLDYALINNKLVITTSKNSMFKAIQVLK